MRKKTYYKKPVAKLIESTIDGDITDNIVWDVAKRQLGVTYEKPKAKIVKDKWNENIVDDLMYRLVNDGKVPVEDNKKETNAMDEYQESREAILKNKNHPTYVAVKDSKVEEVNREKLAKEIKKEEDAHFLERNGYHFEIGM